MKRGSGPEEQGILPVPRTKSEARQAYDIISTYYGYTLGAIGRRYAEKTLRRLAMVEGEKALEIGFGTGHCLGIMSGLVGGSGLTCGLDISAGMIRRTKGRLAKKGLAGRVELCCGDATCLPFGDGVFDSVLMTFALEVLDTPDIPVVLAEIKRVLRPGGRLGVACMSKEDGRSLFVGVYEWIHTRWPKYVGTRPIYARRTLLEAGYVVTGAEKLKILGLPAEIIVAVKATPAETGRGL
jgi:ubiquinone/menaquinone biosynthesis C-methylase UbiE